MLILLALLHLTIGFVAGAFLGGFWMMLQQIHNELTLTYNAAGKPVVGNRKSERN